MFTRKFAFLLPSVALLLLPAVCSAQSPKLGRALTPEEIQKVDITVAPDGKGLPPGSGTVSAGATVYAKSCQSCHGAQGAGKPQDPLTGGLGTLATAKPVKTPASYWPVATTLFDYIRRAMPITSPQSLTNDEVYAVTAYIL
jgi:cytochrome c